MIGLGVRTNKINAGGATPPPVNTIAPGVSGTAVVGQTLTTTNGTWSNSPTSYTYQWYRGATLITGATSSTYVLLSADAGQNIKCTVTATNAGGSASADSNIVAILSTLLDIDISGIESAYDLRLLRGAYYGSPCVRVRRSSDNTEQNIGFTTSGNLDVSSLLSFVGANNGYVVIWYDQSGNSINLTQSTPSAQPRIVNAGVLDTINGKPTLYFNGTSATIPTNKNWESLFIAFAATNSGLKCLIGNNLTTNNHFAYSPYIGQGTKLLNINKNSGGVNVVGTKNYTTSMQSLRIQNVGLGFHPNYYLSNSLDLNGGATTDLKQNILQISGSTAGRLYEGYLTLFINYTTDKSSNAAAIDSNIRTYYGIS